MMRIYMHGLQTLQGTVLSEGRKRQKNDEKE